MIVVRHNIDTLDRQLPRLAREPATAATRSPSATCPQRAHIDVPVREQLIVELYSK